MKKINYKLSIFEIALIGILLSLAVTAKYFDNFIPHVHPLHIVCLITGIAILRTIPSFLLVGSYVLLSSVIFGVEGPTLIASVLHTCESLTLLLICITTIYKEKSRIKHLILLISLIIISCMLYLFIMILGDSEYTRVTNSNTPFWERVRLALIYPGDWMNLTVSCAFSVVVAPIVYSILNPLIINKLKVKY
ncbi:hypothetical protein [Mycoplasma todarodis]|uniref:Uncharacterized protein n=1 Tax=Mycoplasma todarodis TaxID=1937191 RepID=A0A4R0XMZ0_9MOLU|nr:hypothetical protein [Mycoplasma todarodis]TCG12104.1 hypothetical protein C4B25_00215 [Mycoplasma todarodis]